MLSEDRWNQLIMRLCGARPKAEVFRGIAAAYCESYRHYHNVEHITHCLIQLDEARHLAESPDCVEYAIWLHDVVYLPGDPGNEEKSALYAGRILSDLACRDCVADEIRNLIVATRHKESPATRDAALIIDIDLSVLGQPPAVYDRYEAAIRAENAWLPFADYSLGRSRILAGFFNRSRVYYTDWFEAKYGSQAKENLARAMAALSISSAPSL